MKIQTIIGWVASGLLAALMLMSGANKFFVAADSDMGKQFIKIGIFENRFMLGGLEIVIAILMLAPRTSALGVLGAIGYWGGAMAVEMSFKMFPVAPLVALTLTTLVAFFRTPELFERALGKR